MCFLIGSIQSHQATAHPCSECATCCPLSLALSIVQNVADFWCQKQQTGTGLSEDQLAPVCTVVGCTIYVTCIQASNVPGRQCRLVECSARTQERSDGRFGNRVLGLDMFISRTQTVYATCRFIANSKSLGTQCPAHSALQFLEVFHVFQRDAICSSSRNK